MSFAHNTSALTGTESYECHRIPTLAPRLELGWSTDLKYHIVNDNGQELLLRISKGEEFGRKKLEYERITKLSELGILNSMPLEFGFCRAKKYVYMLLTWIKGKEAEEELDTLDATEQRKLGIEGGCALKTIHSVRGILYNETRIDHYRRKIERLIELYKQCSIKFKYGSDVIDFIQSNLFHLEGREVTLQHGDYHVGNFIITENSRIGIIDFNRSSCGDPRKEYDRYVLTWRISIPFAIGQIDGYFNHDVPESFFKQMSLYNATNMLRSIPWAIPFGEADVKVIYDCYDGFQSFIPKWYHQRDATKKNTIRMTNKSHS